MGTGEALALFIQGEAGSLQSESCAGFAAQDASPHVLRASLYSLNKSLCVPVLAAVRTNSFLFTV